MEKVSQNNISKCLIQSKIQLVLPHNKTHTIELIKNNFSTTVYKIIGKKIYYLRIANSKKENFIPENIIHEKLGKIGVKVPKVI